MALFGSLFLSLVLLIPILLIFLEKKKKNGKDSKQIPPSPPGIPILENLHQLGPIPHRSFWELSKKHGPVVLLNLGKIRLLIVSSTEAARDVLKVHDLACCSRPQKTGVKRLTYNFQDIGFSPYSENWREMRKIAVLELFSVKRTQSFQFIREEEVASFIDLLTQSAASATPVDIGEKIFSLTGSIMFRMSFGKSFRGSDLDNQKRLKQLIHDIETVLGGFSAREYLPYVGWIYDRITGIDAKIEKVFHEMDTVFQQVVDEHLKPGRMERHQDIIDVMLATETDRTDEDGFVQQKIDRIKAVLLDIFLGAIDTTAITMIWAMTELVKNPKLLKKAQDEIRNCAGNKRRVTEDDLEQLPYLKMVLKETLRLHPLAPQLLRETMSHCKISCYDVEPNTRIAVNAWAIARDPKYGKNPEEFNPERFADKPVDFKRQDFDYLPFGSGRRGCPGMIMGLLTTELLLSNLLYCFDWKLPEGMKVEDIDLEEEAGVSLTVCKKKPLLLVPVRYVQ